jgi:DnaJ-domain-containing protein 1
MSFLTRPKLLRILIYCKLTPSVAAFSRNRTDCSKHRDTKDGRFYAACFQTLELDPDSSQDLVRRQYIRLVKKFHPDSAKSDSEKEAFMKVFLKIDEVRYTHT